MKRKSGIKDTGKADVDLFLATKAIVERDLELGLVTEQRLRYAMIASENRKQIVQELRANGHSTRKISKLTGWSQSTIIRDARAEPSGSESEPNDTAQKLQARDDARKEILYRKVAIDSRLHVGDFRRKAQCIPDESVELVFTDPPYDREAIPLYGAAALEAARILKPGGSMICYCGHVVLPHVLPQMIQHLKYFWIGAAVHDVGPSARMTRYGIIVGFKPLLWFVKQDDTRGGKQQFIRDTVLSPREKETHPWQQALAAADHFISHLTSQNGIVVDFFAGGGTTIVAANNLKRQWIAFEINEDTARLIQERLNGVQGEIIESGRIRTGHLEPA